MSFSISSAPRTGTSSDSALRISANVFFPRIAERRMRAVSAFDLAVLTRLLNASISSMLLTEYFPYAALRLSRSLVISASILTESTSAGARRISITPGTVTFTASVILTSSPDRSRSSPVRSERTSTVFPPNMRIAAETFIPQSLLSSAAIRFSDARTALSSAGSGQSVELITVSASEISAFISTALSYLSLSSRRSFSSFRARAFISSASS